MEVANEWKKFPQARLLGVAVLWISLASIVDTFLAWLFIGTIWVHKRLAESLWFLYCWLSLLWDIAENLFIIITAIFWIGNHGCKARERGLKLSDQVQDTANEWWLVESDDLDKPLSESLDSLDVEVGLERTEKIGRASCRERVF